MQRNIDLLSGIQQHLCGDLRKDFFQRVDKFPSKSHLPNVLVARRTAFRRCDKLIDQPVETLGFRAGINFYAYVDNNPINANDPTGLVTNDPMDSFSKRMLRMPGQLFAGAIDFARETFLPPSFTLSAGPGVGLTGTGVNIELSGGITVGTHKDSTIFMIEGSLLINNGS